MEKIVKKFCEKLKIKNPIIYGHSAGSAISIIFTSENKVKELNLIQPAGLKYYNSIYSILFRIYLLHLFLVLLITLLTFIKYFFVQ